jgi:hypothetical protein
LGIVNSYLDSIGVPGLDSVSADGIKASTDYNGFNFRVFGGLSFDIFVIRIDLTGIYNSSGNLGANLGIRFQL